MARLSGLVLFSACVAVALISLAMARDLGHCGGSCSTDDDCLGKLACMKHKCNDDPDMHTSICGKHHGGGSGGGGGDNGLKHCGESCKSNDECDGQLACMGGQCGDDPDMHTNICNAQGPSPGTPSPPSPAVTLPPMASAPFGDAPAPGAL